MKIQFTPRQVAAILHILTPNIATLDRIAGAIGEDSWELESMAHGRKAPSAKVLQYLELKQRGRSYVWVSA